MTTASQSNLEAIKDIKKIMERSSRFISLSGWSGIAAGVCALIGAWVAQRYINNYVVGDAVTSGCPECLRNELLITAAALHNFSDVLNCLEIALTGSSHVILL